MTPQERQLISDLFDRLATLEAQPRDSEAVDAINAGLKRAPNAIYPLVQTVLLQDEALKRADTRIRELETQGGAASQPAARTASVPLMRPRPSPWAQPQPAASVPPSQPNYAPPPAQQPQAPQPYAPQQPQSSGGSFLGTAAAAAAGVIGGTLLMNSMRGLFGGDHKPSAFGGPELGGSGGGGGTPWDPGARNSDLAREAGVNDIGRGGRTAAYDEGDASRRTGLFDTAQNDAADEAYEPGDDEAFDVGGDFGGGDDTA
jgi:hypothetical protein